MMRGAMAGVSVAALVIGIVLALTHYGDAHTLNEGYAVGSDTARLQVGLETRGTPGVFGHLDTPWGVASDYTGTFTWCPTGMTDMQCGS